MNKYNIKIDILPNQFLKEDGTFNKKEALNLSGKIAGVCYSKEGFKKLENEPEEKTNKRIERTLKSGHHSVYDHIFINLNMQNIPKILAMILNNEHQYTTSEKSARYTPITTENNKIITKHEYQLYNKWINIFKIKIKEKYGNILNENKIEKLAQENARYLITVFMPTHMIYTTSLRQINNLASWMQKYIDNTENIFIFEYNLIKAMKDFIKELDKLNLLDENLMTNDKNREISLFGKNLDQKEDIFQDIYSTTYKGSFAQLAQAQRHRTLDYQLERSKNKEYYIPEIIKDQPILVQEWLEDINKVKSITPQGELVTINETGKFDDFILKCKERLCSSAQLEIMKQTKETLQKYKEQLEKNHHPLKDEIEKYSKGARCTFPDYDCPNDCHFNEGKSLIRKI